MLWGRKVILQSRNANGVQVDVAALRIDARCVRSRVFDDNELEATIHNANEDTISKFLQRGANVALFAGYEQGAEPGLMYPGDMLPGNHQEECENIEVFRVKIDALADFIRQMEAEGCGIDSKIYTALAFKAFQW